MDGPAVAPYLRLTGSASMTFDGLAGALSAAAIDLTGMDSGATLNFSEDIFATPPNVLLAPGITWTLPESDTGTTRNDWRWVYDDAKWNAGETAARTATLRKTRGGDLIVGRTLQNNVQIDEGTLWLSTGTDGNYTFPASIAGDGIFGKTGSGALTVQWNQLGTTGASGGVLARCDEGTLYFDAAGSDGLRSNMSVRAEKSGTVYVRCASGAAERHNASDFVFEAVDGGTIELGGYSNLFTQTRAQMPNFLLDNGRLYNDGGAHMHIGTISTRGNSSLVFGGNDTNAWNREALNLWDGLLTIESGNLAAYPDPAGTQNNSLVIRALDDYGHGTASYIDVANGAAFYSDLPIQGGQSNANRNIIKTGGGIWVQTRSTGNGVSNNGASWWASDIRIREGTLRFNLGTLEQVQQSGDRTIQIYSGARLDGEGAIRDKSTVRIDAGATIASGLPEDWAGIDREHPWYANLPASFKGPASNTIGRLRIQGGLTLADGAILEVNLDDSQLLEVNGTVTLGSTLNVRLQNLPTSLPTARRLTNFTGTVSGSPNIVCPEAVALDALVRLCTEAEATGVGDADQLNLWLVPSEANYVWTDETGLWSSELWRMAGEPVAFPYVESAASTNAPTARIEASARDAAITVDKGNRTSEGRLWNIYALILASERDRTATLVQGAPVTTVTNATSGLTMPSHDGLNMPSVGVSLWKLGRGDTVFETPLAFGAMDGSCTATIAQGGLVFRRALVMGTPIAGTERNSVPVDMEIAEGATVTFDLTATEAEVNWLAGLNATQTWQPLAQTLTGDFTGSGTLAVTGASAAAATNASGESLFGASKPNVRLAGTADSGLSYRVSDGATLTLAGAIPESSYDPATRRVAEVGLGGRLELSTTNAIGWATNWVWRLSAATEAAGNAAVVATSQNARVRGAIQVVRSGDDPDEPQMVTFGTNQAYVDGYTSFDVPANTTLAFLGFTQTPGNVTAGGLEKLGAGTLQIAGEYGLNLPFTLTEGTVSITGAIAATDLNDGATIPDWTVMPGATLAFNVTSTGAQDFGNGTFTLREGATLDVGGSIVGMRGVTRLEDGAVIALGNGGQIGTLTFNSNTTVEGTVRINLDKVDLDALAAAGNSSYQLVTFASGVRLGSGTFTLAGEKLVALSQRGWTLHDAGDSVVLRAFGNGNFYTWAGTDADTGAGNWANTAWVANGGTAREPWPEEGTPAVVLQDRDPIDASLEIPAEARTIDWTLAGQTLSAFRCDNALPADGDTELSHDYTLTASGGGSNALSIRGDFLKTGDATLTVSRILSFGAEGVIRLLGGETVIGATLRADSGNFTVPVTLAGDATLRFTGSANRNLLGRLEGDGTGVIAQSGTGTLTLGAALDAIKALRVENGTAYLAADEHYAVLPEITLAEGTILGYSGALSAGGAVSLNVNPGETPAGTFLWQGETSSETSRAPRLATADGAPLGVAHVRYDSAQGHLILDPGILHATATLALEQGASETEALWLGNNTDNGSVFALAGLSADAAHGGIIGVEPAIDAFANPVWATNRVVTLTLDPALDEASRTFAGTFMGALSPEGREIRAGLTVLSATPDDAAAKPRFVYSGASTDAHLGVLTVGRNARVEVNGTWSGDIAVDTDGGELAGSGTLGAEGRTIRIPAGATLSAAAYGRREQANGTYREETVPTTLTVADTLRLEPAAKLRVLVRKDLQGAPWVSCVETKTLSLPMVTGDAEEVMIDVTVEIEPDATASNVKIIGWEGLAGGGKINGTVTVVDPEGNPVEGSFTLRQKTDGLYLYRSDSRFWMILK